MYYRPGWDQEGEVRTELFGYNFVKKKTLFVKVSFTAVKVSCTVKLFIF